jgi:AcrR family transcriptional regulator
MGPIGSPNWSAMLDAAEDILREEGYAALTSRRVAERVGVKQRLVYYYFQTMDDLIVYTFQRLSTRELERLDAASASERPLHALWQVAIETSDARTISEFTALSLRIERLKAEVAGFVERSRAIQVGVVAAALERRGGGVRLAAPVWAMLATSLALTLTREAQLGIAAGHHETTAAVLAFLDELEPG